jgi:hypothetical protein
MIVAALMLLAQTATMPSQRSHPTLRRLSAVAGHAHISADLCSRNPKLFKIRTLTAGEATALIDPAMLPPAIELSQMWARPSEPVGHVVSGACTRFIKSFGNGVILANNARFGIKDDALVPMPPADPGSGPQPSHFVPPANIRKIDATKFVEGNSLSLVQTFGSGMALWSDGKRSVIGTIRCVGVNENPCSLDHLILSSSFRIREFGIVPPPPDFGMHVGSLWLWVALRSGEEAFAGYTFRFE